MVNAEVTSVTIHSDLNLLNGNIEKNDIEENN